MSDESLFAPPPPPPVLRASDDEEIAAIDAENDARRALEAAQAVFERARAHRVAVLQTRGVLPR